MVGSILLFNSAPPVPQQESGFLHVAGRDFADDKGQPWLFAAYHAHLLMVRQPDEIRARFIEARGYGANVLVVIGCHLSPWKRANGFLYDPRAAGHAERLAQLFDIAAEEHMRVCFKALADCDGVSISDQQGIWALTGTVARGRWNAIPSLGNEAMSNGWNPNDFAPIPDPQGLLQSNGDLNGDVAPHLPVWDFAEFESRRDLPKALTDASCTELYYGWDGRPGIKDRPIVNIEPAFFSDTDPDKWGDHRWTDPALALRLGGYIAVGCAGGGFGASDGLEGLPLQPRAAECARQFYRGLRSAFQR